MWFEIWGIHFWSKTFKIACPTPFLWHFRASIGILCKKYKNNTFEHLHGKDGNFFKNNLDFSWVHLCQIRRWAKKIWFDYPQIALIHHFSVQIYRVKVWGGDSSPALAQATPMWRSHIKQTLRQSFLTGVVDLRSLSLLIKITLKKVSIASLDQIQLLPSTHSMNLIQPFTRA